MFDKGLAHLLLATISGLIGMAWTVGATATQTCQGSYTTALLQPLPPHIVVGLDIHDRSPRNLTLAERFLEGVRGAGVAVGAQPNVLLHVNVSHLGETSAKPERGSVPSYSEFSGPHGGLEPELPALPSTGLTTPRSPPSPPLMFVRVDATVGNSPRISWLAAVQCKMSGQNDQFAEDLGRLVGNTLGKRTERRPF